MINDVKRIPMFDRAPEAFLEWISDETTSMVVRLLEPGDDLFQERESVEYAYYLLEGELEIIETDQGVERVTSRIAVGSLGGRIPITPPSPCSCTARAVLASRVLGVPKESMKRVFRSQIEIVQQPRRRTRPPPQQSIGRRPPRGRSARRDGADRVHAHHPASTARSQRRTLVVSRRPATKSVGASRRTAGDGVTLRTSRTGR